MSQRLLNLKFLVLVIVTAVAVLATAGQALADKLHLKDGRVFEGEVVREGDGFVYFKVKVGSLEQEQFFTTDQIDRIERDAVTTEEKKVEAGKAKSNPSGTTKRIAILNFGPPSSWQGKAESVVGLQVTVDSFKRAIPLLEKDGVTDVVVRINSGGGYTLEMPKFQDLFENEYKPRFRTVGWVESAISAAAMSPWVLEEFYFLPEGNMGGCTEYSGALNASKGLRLEEILMMMEKASAKGKRNPLIMRAMQIQQPLSASIDEKTGQVTWYPDATTGEFVVNPDRQVLTITASQAVKFKLAKGIAATPDELARVMGYEEWEWAGQQATTLVDDTLKECTKAATQIEVAFNKYERTVAVAAQIPDRQRRGAEVGIARRHLAEIKRISGLNPNFELFYGTTPEWFREQEERLRRLMQ